jgi:hypothetical protein
MEPHDVEIIESGFSTRPNGPRKKKLVVFDLDETIGDFYMFYYFWRFLMEQYEYSPDFMDATDFMQRQEVINQILDLYPEFFRPGILVIFQYLIYKKRLGQLSIMWLYTNNNLSPQYPIIIKNYIHHMIQSELIDNIVSAFSIKGRRVDLRRLVVEKEYLDFLHCLNYGEDLDICFVDNDLHEGMVHCQVFYIKLNTYRHGLGFSEMMTRLFQSPMGDILFHNIQYDHAISLMTEFMRKNDVIENQGTPDSSYECSVSLQLLGQIKHFFKTNGRPTRMHSTHTRKRTHSRSSLNPPPILHNTRKSIIPE